MREYVRCCITGDPLAAQLYLLDTSKGPDQQVKDMQVFMSLDGGSYEGITLSPDRSKLFLSHYTRGFPAGIGPSSITEQSLTGGRRRTIYTDTTSAITSIVNLNQNTLLVLVESYDNSDSTAMVYTGQNGLWRVNADGSGWKRMPANRLF